MNKFVNKNTPLPTTAIYTEEVIRSFNFPGLLEDADTEMISSYGFALLPSPTNAKSNETDVLVANKDQANVWYCQWISKEEFDNAQTHKLMSSHARAQRNFLLAQTDWTQGKDVPDATSNIWTTYRQSLRDITSQVGFPTSIVWPTPPAN